MSVRIVSAAELRRAVAFEDLIEPVARAFKDFSAGLGKSELITLFPAERPELGDVYVKTGTLQGHKVFIVKVSPWFAVNVERGQSQGGFIGVFDSATGHTLAILNEEHYLSDIRTAAAGALAARLLAPAQVEVAAVLGSGVQAYWQPLALHHERPFKTLRIWARNLEKAARLKERLRKKLSGVRLLVSSDLEHTVRNTDVLITTTASREPLVRGEWLRAGQHITAVGADDTTKCELNAATLKRARVFVDSLQTAAETGNIYRAIRNGNYRLEHVAGEVGQILSGKPGRQTPAEITIATFAGIGVQDLVAAEIALGKLK